MAPRERLTLVLCGPASAAALDALCNRLPSLIEDADDVVTVDLVALERPDLATIELLARLQLIARRLGRTIQLRDVDDPVRDLLTLTGLTDVLTSPSIGPRRP